MDITELIEDHEESIFLDFKSQEYHADNRSELIKDALAFANASYTGERYIIIGVSKSHTGITITPVEKPQDAAAIQQLIHDNITPELVVSYTPFDYKGQNVMVLTISNTNEQPYYPRKQVLRGDRPFLKQNDLWIRKGSHKVWGLREDLEKIYARRYAKSSLSGKIDLSFSNGTHELEINVIRELKWPTVLNKAEIEQQILEKEELVRTDAQNYQARYTGYHAAMGVNAYQAMDLSTLRQRLESLERNFADEDKYYLNEQRAYKLQLVINNSGNEHLKDAMVRLIFPEVQGFTVAGHIYLNTYQQGVATGIDHQAGYPKVEQGKHSMRVSQQIGEIRHRVPTEIFIKPLRIVPLEDVAGKTIKVQAIVYADNLPEPQQLELTISFK